MEMEAPFDGLLTHHISYESLEKNKLQPAVI